MYQLQQIYYQNSSLLQNSYSTPSGEKVAHIEIEK